MAEQTFKSPNFYEREIDLSAPTVTGPTGVPGAVIGTANKGPAFVPVTVADMGKFNEVFGGIAVDSLGTYAANEFLKNKTALTYMRVLGAGSNATTADIAATQQYGTVDIAATQQYGTVVNAGFRLSGSVVPDTNGRHMGCLQFITAQHNGTAGEATKFPILTDNSSITDANAANLVRGVVLMASGASLRVASTAVLASTGADSAAFSNGLVQLIISSSYSGFSSADNKAGLKSFDVSLDPSSQNYFGKLLNKDPDKFVQEQHLLYLDFAVDSELAVADTGIAIVSGSAAVTADNSVPLLNAFGQFNTRFKAADTTYFISQPFGDVEYDLFKFEALDDGDYASKLYKISITNVRASTDPTTRYGLFNVQVRDFSDTDFDVRILEQFTDCTLDPASPNYIGRLIGDRKTYFNFDAFDRAERRLVSTGRYSNQSKYVRVVISSEVENKLVPATCLPFGFRGLPCLKTTSTLTDNILGVTPRLGVDAATPLSGAIVPPIPFRVKVTRGSSAVTGSNWMGAPGLAELTAPQLYWGVKFERTTNPLDPNISAEVNPLVESMTKLQGVSKTGVLTSGRDSDTLNNNKFTLAKVALKETSIAGLTDTVAEQMRSAFYMREATLDSVDYTIDDPNLANRLTFASLLNQLDAVTFNQYSQFLKFTNIMGGGFDGVNFLDPKARKFNDRSTSFDDGAQDGYTPAGLVTNLAHAGSTTSNNAVNSYVTAIDVMTDPMVINHNLLAIPGIKEPYLTDYASDKIRDYGMAMYVMDIPSYDDDSVEIYSDSRKMPSVSKTVAAFNGRSTDNNFVAAYFPDVYVFDDTNRRSIKAPASVAAFGALGFNDRIAYPWFAPAGFNRASLDFVKNVAVRLNTGDRDNLYQAKINPIASFPRLGYVIYGQKTLQANKSALDRVNVRRLVLEVKRVISNLAKNIVFEQNTAVVRNNFVADASLRLATIQEQSGIEKFQVVCNETNNTQSDIDLNRLNGRIVIVPTRVIEFIAIDFIITNSGVAFV